MNKSRKKNEWDSSKRERQKEAVFAGLTCLTMKAWDERSVAEYAKLREAVLRQGLFECSNVWVKM